MICNLVERILIVESSNGDIVIGSKPKNGELRHGFTIHQIQGETIYKPNKIFIDLRNMFAKEMIYTAVSRAEYINQIYLIV